MFRCESPTCYAGCAKPTVNNYQRTEKEVKDWPDKRMPIALCEKHAKKRIPLTEKQVSIIMKRIFPLIILSLSFIGCVAQSPNLEVIPTGLTAGSVIVVGNNRTVIGVPQSNFKGDAGAQGVAGRDGKDATLSLPGIDTAKEGDVWVSDGKGGLKRVTTTLTEDFGEFLNVKNGFEVSTVIAKKNMYEIAIGGRVNSLEGSLLFRVKYTNANGDQVEAGIVTLSQTGEFTPGGININVKKDTPISLLTIAAGTVDYNFSFNIHQQ